MASYARLLGLPGDAARFDALAASGTKAFNRRFFDSGRGCYDNGTQTSCVLPLAFGLVPEASRADVFARLADNITRTTAGHIGTGLVGGQWLNRVLTEGGRADLVHGFVTAETYPSWGYMARQGATTIWELWNGDTANPAMNSGNHLMLVGDSLIWLFESLAGIKPDPAAPGFKHIILKPHPIGDLEQVRASHQSPYGEIVSDWRRKGGELHWRITVPPNTIATAHVPGADPSRLSESGHPVATRPEWREEASTDGRIVLRLEAGNYHFSYQ
jgi:alpha-L-rhamnosidase